MQNKKAGKTAKNSQSLITSLTIVTCLPTREKSTVALEIKSHRRSRTTPKTSRQRLNLRIQSGNVVRAQSSAEGSNVEPGGPGSNLNLFLPPTGYVRVQSLRGRGVTSTYFYPNRLHHVKALERLVDGVRVRGDADGSDVDVDEGVTNVEGPIKGQIIFY